MFPAPVRYGIMMGILAISLAAGWRAYAYFSDVTAPEVALSGMEQGGYYAGDISCLLTITDNYKVADFSLYIDKKPLVVGTRASRKQAEHRFVVPTVALSNGAHELTIEASDASYRRNRTTETVSFIVDNEPLQAAFARPDNDIKVFQGKTLHLFIQTNKPVKSVVAKALGRDIIGVPEDPGSRMIEVFVPVACEDRPSEYPLIVEIIDCVGNRLVLDSKFQVVAFPFPHQKLKLNKDVIDAELAAGKEQRLFDERIAELTSRSPARKLWQGSFYAPMTIRGVSTQFGTVRETQHRGKYAHKAIDLLGEPKCVVWAPQDGIIVLQDRYGMSGNTVVIDHGCGVLSVYFHLESFSNLHVGDEIKQGNPLGTMGKTGFASGYHLHLGLFVHGIPVDPMQWVAHDF